MTIPIGGKISALRTEKGISQDVFAKYLGVSCGEVIDWENGKKYPSLELIPMIANYFDVTSDELICMERFGNADKIKGYIDRFYKSVAEGKLPDSIEILREGLIHFPKNYTLKCLLMYSLYISCDRPAAVKHYSMEIAELYRDIVGYCTDDAIRLEAKRVFCLHSFEDLKNTAQALEIAKTLPARKTSREDMMPKISDGERRLSYIKENISAYLSGLTGSIESFIEANSSLSSVEKTELLRLVLNLVTLVYNNGDYLYTSAEVIRINKTLAMLYIGLGRNDEALGRLADAAECAILYDNLPTVSKHTSPLVKGLAFDKSRIDISETKNGKTMRQSFLEELSAPCFDAVKYSDVMKKICNMLIK